jgi:predicted DNA-binding protein with PD1-like motif
MLDLTQCLPNTLTNCKFAHEAVFACVGKVATIKVGFLNEREETVAEETFVYL